MTAALRFLRAKRARTWHVIVDHASVRGRYVPILACGLDLRDVEGWETMNFRPSRWKVCAACDTATAST